MFGRLSGSTQSKPSGCTNELRRWLGVTQYGPVVVQRWYCTLGKTDGGCTGEVLLIGGGRVEKHESINQADRKYKGIAKNNTNNKQAFPLCSTQALPFRALVSFDGRTLCFACFLVAASNANAKCSRSIVQRPTVREAETGGYERSGKKPLEGKENQCISFYLSNLFVTLP